MDMKEQLEGYVKKVRERHESCQGNEEGTKQSLISPLFTILGYDVTDPCQCKAEYKANFGRGRSRDPVDWAFCINESLAFLVEAKAVGEDISKYDEQLGDYYAKEHGAVKLGVLTTGVQWHFFTDLDKENVMDTEPFLRWDVLNDTIPIDFLTILQREKFKPENIKTFAKGKYRQSLLVAELTRLLEPSPEFIRLAIQNLEELEEHKLTTSVLEEWKPILGRAISEWAKQQRLQTALDCNVDGHVTNGSASAGVTDEPADDDEESHPDDHRISLEDLIKAGVLKAPAELTATYKHHEMRAQLSTDGVLTFDGKTFKTCSGAACFATGTVSQQRMIVNGWRFWSYRNDAGEIVLLDDAREEYLKHKAR